MGKKSYFHKRFDKLAVLYANAIIVNQDCIKENVRLEEQIADMELLIRDLKKVNHELKTKLVEAKKCADSNTD